MTSREDALALDRADPLAPLREQFVLPEGLLYLDGNSLGVLPKATAARVQRAVVDEWGRGLIGSWNSAGWIDLPRRVGDKIARLVGAAPGELVVTDSTSVNLYKVLAAALAIAREDAPQRRLILSERSNFPTDLYIAESLAAERGFELLLVEEAAELPRRLGRDVAVLMLTHVNYRSGRLHDLRALTRAAHDAGALALWDLAHSAGAVPVSLGTDGADFAVGCGYKYLNGGPGAPAFVWVHPRHASRFRQPLSGWMGHAAPFEFTPGYRPAAGIGRYLCGTPPVLSMVALECGVDSVLAAEPLGGIAALRTKSLALTRLFADLVDERCAAHGLAVVSPRDDAHRGSQVCLSLVPEAASPPPPEGAGSPVQAASARPAAGAYAIVQALIARGVVGDFRAGDGRGAPDILRFGFTPLYTRFVDAWDAVDHLKHVLDGGEWREARFQQRQAVT